MRLLKRIKQHLCPHRYVNVVIYTKGKRVKCKTLYDVYIIEECSKCGKRFNDTKQKLRSNLTKTQAEVYINTKYKNIKR